MIPPRAWIAAAWLGAGCGTAALAWSSTVPVVPTVASRTTPPIVAEPPATRAYLADSLVTRTIGGNVFRVDRRPARVAYDPSHGTAAGQVSGAVPKPALVLVGLVIGSQPSAVIEGFPGVEDSRVVRLGDVVSELRVARITGDRVVIVGMDTTWVLKVREPWK